MTTTSLKPSHRNFQEELQSNSRQSPQALEPLGKLGWQLRANKDIPSPTASEAEAIQKHWGDAYYLNGALLSGAFVWNHVTMPLLQAPTLSAYNICAIPSSQPTPHKGYLVQTIPTFVTANGNKGVTPVGPINKPGSNCQSSFLADVKVRSVPKPESDCPSSFLDDVKVRPAASTEANCDLSLPVIDLGGLRSGDPITRKKIVREVGHATEEWGFFQVVNHSVPDELVERMHDQAQQFFNLPLHVKQLSEIVGPNRRCLGYKGTFEAPEQNIPIKESLADFRSPAAPVANRAAKVWPKEGNPTFSRTIQEHCDSVGKLGLQLLDLLAESLGLQRTFFSRHFQPESDCIGTWRLHHFPPNTAPSHVWRTAPHSDPSVLTILKQDVGGLQVKKPRKMEGGRPVVNGESPAERDLWINVKPLPDSFVVNVGDILEAWSNGRFPSVEHRVALNENCERFSTVNFLDAGPSLSIEAPAELIDDTHPSRFIPFIAGDYRSNFEATKRQGDIRKGMALDYVRRTPIRKQ